MSKPEFIIVPGAWHDASCFEPTTVLLEKAGYTVHGIDLPCFGATPPLQNFDPDVETVKNTVNKVLSSGKDLVMLYHSYGGVPGSEALAEYLKDLENGGKEGWGKIRRLVFIAAFALPEGGSLMGALGGKDLPWFIVNGDEVKPDKPEEIFYNDLSPEVAAQHVAKLKHHSYRTLSSQLTVAPWKVIPSTFVVCEKDNAIPSFAQEGMIAAAQQAAPNAFDVVEKCDASHSPFLSQPDWLAEKLVKAAA